MKKFNFLTTTLILSLIAGAGLVACGEISTPTTDAPTSIVEAPSRVQVTNPTDVVVGQTVNLDDCVEVIGVSNDNAFDAILETPETATLEGHVLTVTKEGEVSVKIQAHNYHKASRVSFTAISTLRAAFKEKMTITNQYFLEDINVSQTGQLSLSGEGIVHNPKYFATPNQSGTYDGMLETKSGNTYQFSCDDLAGTNLDVAPGVQSAFNLYYLSMPFSLSYMDLETVYDEKTGEPAYLSTTDDLIIKNYCNTSSGLIGPSEYPERLMAAYPGQYTSIDLVSQELIVEFLPTDEAGTIENSLVSILVYFELSILPVGQTEPVLDAGYLTYAVAHTDTSLGTIAGVDAYITSGQEPAEISIDPFKNMMKGIAEGKNYTQLSKFWWSSSSASNSAPWAETVAGMPNGVTVQQAVTENTIFTMEQDGENVSQSFYTVNNGQVYAGDNYQYDENGEVVVDENGNPQYSDSFTVTPMEGKTSIWGDDTLSMLTVAAAADDSFYSTIKVAAMQESNGMYAYSFGTNAVLAQAFTANAAGWGFALYNFFAQNEWFDGINVEVVAVPESGILQVHLVIGVRVTQTQVGYYHILTQFSKIGTTTAPDLSPLFS